MRTLSFQDHIRALLNSLDPNDYLEDLQKNESLSPAKRLRRYRNLQNVLDKAREDQVPLGLEILSHSSLENAYLYRQRYIAALCRKHDIVNTVLNLLAVILGALIVLFFAWVFF